MLLNLNLVKKKPRPRSLEEVLAHDELNLLKVNEDDTPKASTLDHSLEIFAPIEKFVGQFKRLPDEKNGNFNEKRLANQLLSLKDSHPKEFENFLAQHQNLLKNNKPTHQALKDHVSQKESLNGSIKPLSPKIYTSLDEILEHDDLGLLEGLDILDTGPKTKRKTPDTKTSAQMVAKTIPCPEFDLFKPCFDKLKLLISEKALKLEPFKGLSFNLERGQFFILKGQYALIASADNDRPEIYATHKHFRVRVILNNGTEYTPLNRSFIRSLDDNEQSFKVLASKKEGERFLAELKDYLKHPSADPNFTTGYLYVLRSKSHHPTLQQFMQTSDLVKIGFCTTSVEKRIANAKNSPTYLCSEVEICQTYRCTNNIKPHQVERLVHALLNEHQLNITLKDNFGKTYRPHEWFTVPLATVEQIIAHIIDGTIQNYRVDPLRGKLVQINS